jgi:hypothetical protein
MKIKIGELYDLYQKYGDLSFKVNTPYGYKNIEWCGITEKNADVYRCELDNGMFVEGADYHKLKKTDNEFVVLKDLQIGEKIQTINGNSSVSSVRLLDEKDTLYDVQVADVHQYYTNGIVSHNTVLTVDLLMFLFFNETTKTSKAEEIFNRFTERNKVVVKGEITIDGDEYIILRNIERKLSKKNEWTVKTELDFYKRLSDGSLQNFTGEQRRETEAFIKTSIGTKEDFLMTILTTATNLEELIDAKPTARGQVLSRFMGLDFLKRKEETAKEIYGEFSKGMLSNIYNSEQLKTDNQTSQDTIDTLTETNLTLDGQLGDTKERILKGQEYRDGLLKSKHNIDKELTMVSPDKVQEEINGLDLQKVKAIFDRDGVKVVEPSEFYHEDKHDEVKQEIKDLITKQADNNAKIKNIEELKSSVDGGIKCEHCGIELMNASITNAKIGELAGFITHKGELEGLMRGLTSKELGFVNLKKEFDEYEKNKLIKEKYELSVERFQLMIDALKTKLDRYTEVQDKVIENNKPMDY